MKLPHLRIEVQIAGLYLIIGGLWIVLSDTVLAALFHESVAITTYQTYNGWVFVCFSAVLFYLLLKYHIKGRNMIDEKNRQHEIRLRQLFEHSLDAILLTAPDGSILNANPAACALFQHTEEELQRIGRSGVVDPNDPRLAPDLEEHAHTGSFHGELTFVRKDGTRFEGEISSILFHTDHDEAQTSMVIRDITERKQAVDKLRASEERYRHLIENMTDVLMEVDEHGILQYISPNYAALSGYAVENVVGISALTHIHPDDLPLVMQKLQSAFTQRESLAYRVQTKDGEWRWIEANSRPYRTSDGDRRLINMARDITERKQAEEKLRESEERLNTILESSPVAIGISRLSDEKIMYVNAAFEKLYGYSQKEALGLTTQHLQIWANEAEHQRFIELLRTEGSVEGFEAVARIKSGEERHAMVSGKLVTIANEPCLMAQIVDITERKRLEEEMIHANALVNALSRVSAQMDTSHALDRVTESLGNGLKELGIDSLIALKEPATQDFIVNYTSIAPSLLSMGETILGVKLIGYRISYAAKSSDNLFKEVVEHKKPLLVPDAAHLTTTLFPGITRMLVRLALKAANVDLGVRVLYLPLISKETVIGLLGLWGADLRESDLPALTVFASQVAATIVQTRLHETVQIELTERIRAEEQLEKQNQRLKVLRELDTAILSSESTDHIVSAALSHIRELIDCQRAHITRFYWETNDAMIYNVRANNESFFPIGTRLPLAPFQDLIQTLAKNQLISINDLTALSDPPPMFQSIIKEGLRSVCILPLFSQANLIGTFNLSSNIPNFFDEAKINLGREVANQVAIAITQNELLKSLREINADLEHRVVERTVELNRANLELQQANRAKDEFLATMSHELRTPLNSILGLSETLLEQRRDPLSERQQKSLQIIEASGHHLLELINDVLDLSKIESGKFDYYPQPIEVQSLCRSSLAFIRQQAARKSIQIEFEHDTAASKLYADPRRLKQIIVNLLTNAVKFTSSGGRVMLQVQADQERGRIRFMVSDTGIGIELKDMGKLFHPFSQIDSSLTREFEGTGLGLALVQRLTDLHGGSVEVESEPGKGSRFTVNIPWAMEFVHQQEALEAGVNLPTTVTTSVPAVPVPHGRGRILFAEDNLANVLTIGEYLESHGFVVTNAADGVLAIELAEKIMPDLILMDIQMPALDGLEAIRRLRQNPRFASTPIIALTALAMPGDRERCLEAGANEYLSKPVSLKSLVKTIHQLLGNPHD